MSRKCGYIALLGRPNAGKSTLLNACLEAKISVVSAKPQTTRNKIIGIYTKDETQFLFLDTPGMHKSDNMHKINKTMNRVAWSVINDSDVVCYLVDVTRGWHLDDSDYVRSMLEKSDKKFCLIATKIDKVKKDDVALVMQKIRHSFNECIEHIDYERLKNIIIGDVPMGISGKRPEETREFKAFLDPYMPEGPWLYPEDDLTDMPQQFICGEMIREQVFRQLGEELPYSCAVKIDIFKHEPKITRISATVIVLKETHKRMVIGAGGSRIKEIGTRAREALEKHLDRKVFLELFVKVQEGWMDNESLIAEYASLKDPTSGI